MSTLVIVGAQWGDEAKGKLVDWLGGEADYVVRYSGGNNAGHTVIVGDKTFKFHLLPAGILHPRCISILGAGMVICPKGLLEELDKTRQLQADLGTLKIHPASHVVFPYHRTQDRLEEDQRGDNKIGTTSRGIGPAYTDKVSRNGIRMAEFIDPDRLRARLGEVVGQKNAFFAQLGAESADPDAIFAEYAPLADRIRPFVMDTDWELQEAVRNGKKVLFEGAQGTFLDLDYGTYPFVTSSHPIAAGAALGTGIGPRDLHAILGVCKAYSTRVGSGPFPTELTGELGDQIREQGQEYGTTTGRGRRCGWLDLVALRHSARLNSMTGLVITRLDVVAGLGPLKVATGYRLRGHAIQHVPSDGHELAAVEPVFQELEGWTEDLRGVRRWEDLPAAVKRYVEFIEEFCDCPAAVLSVGPDRAETILRRPDLIWI